METSNGFNKERHDQCQICLQCFSSVEEFGKHVYQDHKGHDSWYPCPQPECYCAFENFTYRDRHIKACHGSRPQRLIKCCIQGCDFQESRKIILMEHLKVVHNVNPADYFPVTERLECVFERCDKMFSRKDNLNRHLKEIHKLNVQDFIDDGGASSSTRAQNNLSPVKKMNGKANDGDDDNHKGVNIEFFSCPIQDCNRQMKLKDHIRAHIRLAHSENPTKYFPFKQNREAYGRGGKLKLKCRVEGCGKMYSKRDKLNAHIREIHKTDPKKIFKCTSEGCEFSCPNRGFLVNHLLRIHKIDPREKTDDKQKQRVGREVYDGEEDSDEGIPLAQRRGRRSNNKGDNYDIRHPCSICKLTFSRKTRLEHHMSTQHGGRWRGTNLICPMYGCGTQWDRKHLLCSHLLQKHNVDPQKYFQSGRTQSMKTERQDSSVGSILEDDDDDDDDDDDWKKRSTASSAPSNATISLGSSSSTSNFDGESSDDDGSSYDDDDDMLSEKNETSDEDKEDIITSAPPSPSESEPHSSALPQLDSVAKD